MNRILAFVIRVIIAVIVVAICYAWLIPGLILIISAGLGAIFPPAAGAIAAIMKGVALVLDALVALWAVFFVAGRAWPNWPVYPNP